jgi:short-subunit dehydrogenase
MPYALITGASKGIGKNIAEGLAARGYDLLLVARSENGLSDLARQLEASHQIKVHTLAVDLSDLNSAKKVVDWVSSLSIRISILVNNAGFGLGGSLESAQPDDLHSLMQVNMLTPVALTRLFIGQLKQENPSYILNIASTAAYQSVPYLNVYAASKAFLLSFSRGLRHELRASSVSVTCICPGPTDTHFVDRAGLGEKPRKMASRFNMKPQDVAEQSIRAMFNKKAEVVPGVINKLNRFFAWLLPKSVLESSAGSIYE